MRSIQFCVYLLHNVDLTKLTEEWEKDDILELKDLSFEDPRKPKENPDLSGMNPDDLLTTMEQSFKGRPLGLYIQTVSGKF